MFEAVETLKAEYAELERQMAEPELHSDQANARRVGKRYAALAPVVRTYDAADRTPRGAGRAAADAARAAGPQRRQGRDPRDQGG
jgi:protein subunit release factor A